MEPLNAEGLHAARAVARWHLGDPSWANRIIDAYLDPKAALEALRYEKEEA